MIGRIVRPADFQRVLATVPRSRSAHFAVHHVSGAPSLARRAGAVSGSAPVVPGLSPDLSTGAPRQGTLPVDDQPALPDAPAPSGHWLGLVVPKRHAKRAVTRNLIKRQVRAAMAAHADQLPPGLWVVRLKMPFERSTFTSPGSDALREATRAELLQVFRRASAPEPRLAQGRRP